MHPILFSVTKVEPFWGDLSGGFCRIAADLADMASSIRVNMNRKLRRAIADPNELYQYTHPSYTLSALRL